MARSVLFRRILTTLVAIVSMMVLVLDMQLIHHSLRDHQLPLLAIQSSDWIGQAYNHSTSRIEQDIVGLLQCPEQNISAATVTSGSHLFCLMARNEALEADCKATRKQMLRLWKTLRETVKDDNVLKLALSVANPMRRSIAKHSNLQIWAPRKDNGVRQVINELSHKEYGDFFPELASGGLFLDGGSNLGFVTLLTALETNATIVSFEAASPTWIMQQLNLICNLPAQRLNSVHSILAALGSNDGSSIELQWREESTITVRRWDKPPSFVRNKIDCQVPVRTIRSVLSDIFGTNIPKIDVFKIDCEGCEYNVIPDFSDKEIDAIGTMIGEIHYGFIPSEHAPSNERSNITHFRLCQHHNFVKFAKECCAFPDLIVKQLNIPVSKVPETAVLCQDFEQWSARNKLFQISNDSGWLNQ